MIEIFLFVSDLRQSVSKTAFVIQFGPDFCVFKIAWGDFFLEPFFRGAKIVQKGSFGIFGILPKYVREGRFEIYQEQNSF